MTSTIRIKRRESGAPGAPSELAAAEIAYNEIDHTLYYGEGNNAGQAVSIESIGGPGTFVKLSNIADIGRNKLHNALFNIQQRGRGPWTANLNMLADRWGTTFGAGDTNTYSVALLTDVDRSAIGDEEAQNAMQNVFVGSSTSGSYSILFQKIEKVRRLSGRNITVSFWARATSGTPKIGIAYQQVFGSGGSPSANVVGNIGVTPALSSTWTRYAVSTTLPSSNGKVFGTTDGTDFTELELWYSSNYTPDRSGGIGVQSGTVQIWGVQLEIGPQATPLEKLDPRMDLANCQRFYQIGGLQFWGYTAAGYPAGQTLSFMLSMRNAPTIALLNTTYSNSGSLTIASATSNRLQFYALATAQGGMSFLSDWTASAEL